MDLVSRLPDEILCHILSFLPTKHAALTPALSKRWHSLWRIDPVYDIDDSVFLHPEEGKGERDDIRLGFVDFVDGVLAMQGDSTIQKFSLKCITGVHLDIVNGWICNVLRRGVSDLDLFLDFSDEYLDDNEYNLPQELFLCKTLVKLKLRSEHCVNWWHPDMGSSLPMLKSLDIDSDLIHTDMIEEFVPSFPVLEELRMANMEWSNVDVTVSSGSLKKLNLHGTGCEDFENPERISFDTPNLLFLSYTDLVAEDYPLVNMKKLLGARINLTLTDEDQVNGIRTPSNDDGDAVPQFGNVVKLMNGLQNVQKLSLLAETLEVLSLCCESMPVFNNLKFLGVTSDKNRGWQAMPVLLRNCPHLETIILEGLLHHVTDKCGDACDCISREEKGRSLTSCPVNRLEIQGFRATMKEMNMIKHFIDYFPSLKRLDVFVEENDPTPLGNPEVSELITEMFDLYNELSNCKAELLIGGNLHEKWTARGYI